jgi:hypothetical protein
MVEKNISRLKLTDQTNNFDLDSLLTNLTLKEIMDLIDYIPEEVLRSQNKFRNTVVISAYALIAIVSFIGNLLVCRVCLQNMTKTNSLILSLSSSDLLMTIFNIPFNIVRILNSEWPFGQLLCFSVPFVQVMVVYVSSITMAAIALHRWKCVSTLTTTPTSNRAIVITIVITWCLSALMAFPTAIFNRIYTTMYLYKPVIRCQVIYPESRFDLRLIITLEAFLTQYIIPLSVSIYMYFKIGKVISSQGKIINIRGLFEVFD